MRVPLVYGAAEIVNWHIAEEYEPGKWRPARCCPFFGWRHWRMRLRIVWAVFTGKYDALNWGAARLLLTSGDTRTAPSLSSSPPPVCMFTTHSPRMRVLTYLFGVVLFLLGAFLALVGLANLYTAASFTTPLYGWRERSSNILVGLVLLLAGGAGLYLAWVL